MVTPPSLAALFAGFGSVGPEAVIWVVLVALPDETTVAGIVIVPSETPTPATVPEVRVQLTVWPVTVQVQPGALTGGLMV